MRRCVLSIASLIAVFAAAPSGQVPDAGSIAGHVRLTPKIKGRALPSTAYPTRAVGAHDPSTLPEIKNVVVYLKDVAFRGALPASTVALRQEHETFVPHVLAITKGSAVDFPNDDPIFHNVFSLSKTKPFDLGMYKNGESREVKVDKAGIVRLGCNLHASMSAYLIVVDAPAYVSTNADGTFSFASLAPGKYRVQAWNERSAEPLDSEVEIKAGENDTKLDLKAGGMKVSPDKFGGSRDVPSK
jgi:plastocyanin